MTARAGELGVAVVGVGVGEAHARAYLQSGHCELRWLYDLDAERARVLAAELGAGRAASTFEEILADPAVDAVSIASFDDAHFEQALAALRAGKHVLVEKPLCRTREEVQQLRRAWLDRPGLVLASNLVLRSAPLYRWARAAVAQGTLGEPYAFDGDYLYGRLHKVTEGWRRDVPDYSVLLGGGVHLVDLMLWLIGQRPRTVTAVGNRISTEGTAFRYLDFAAATFVFDSGLVGRITANFGSVHPHQHVVRLFGTRATLIHDDCGVRLHESRDPAVSPRRLELDPLPASKGELVPEFVAAILGGADTRGAAEHELDVISACVAADRSLLEGRGVEIEY
jgi:predicted dehydrogenase